MKELVLTDIVNDPNNISKFTPQPKLKQDISRKITDSNLYLKEKYIKDLSVEDIWFSMLNRITTVNYDLTLYSGFLIKIKKYILENEIKKVSLNFNKSNSELSCFLFKNLNHIDDIDVVVNINEEHSTKYSISKGSSVEDFFKIINQVSSYLVIFILTFNSCLFSLIVKFLGLEKKDKVDYFWMSFANNREKIDYNIIRLLKDKGLKVLAPTAKFNKERLDECERVYFNRRFDFSFSLVKLVFKIFFISRTREKEFLKKVSEISGCIFPLNYNIGMRFNFKLYSYNTIVLLYLIKNLSESEQVKLIYRGGNADSIILTSLLENVKTYLLPHGTEFYPLDHSTINFISVNILASEGIVSKWRSDGYQLSSTTLLPFGRPEYKFLVENVNRKDYVPDEKLTIGIVLTYGTTEDTIKFVDDIVEAISSAEFDFNILIKQRPNLIHDLSTSKYYSKLTTHDGDIFSFLSLIHVVTVGVSSFGVVGMVGTDAIYCDIPTIFYFGDKGFNNEDLGYSWTEELDKTSYNTLEELKTLFKGINANNLLKLLVENQRDAKYLIGDSTKCIDMIVDYWIKEVETK